MSLVKMDLRLRYRGTVLGIGWSLLNPILMTIVFCIVFSSWHENADWRSDAPYFLCGLAIFNYFRDAITSGCQNFFRNESYIRQCPLPIAIYPLRTVLGSSIHFMISIGVVLMTLVLLLPGSGIERLIYLLPTLPAFGLLLILAWSMSVLAGFAQVYFQDMQHLADVLFQVFFFLTPILFKMDLLVQKGVGWLGYCNPVVWFLDLIRTPLLTGTLPSLEVYAWASGFTAVVLSGALIAISYLEKRIIFHL